MQINKFAPPPGAGQGARFVGILSGAIAVTLMVGVAVAINAAETALARATLDTWLLAIEAVLVLILGSVLVVSARRFSTYTVKLGTVGPTT